MAVKEHFCDDHPDGAGWYPGPTDACEHHRRQREGRSQTPVRWGKNIRRKADQERGIVGIDRGTHVSGIEGQ